MQYFVGHVHWHSFIKYIRQGSTKQILVTVWKLITLNPNYNHKADTKTFYFYFTANVCNQ